MRSLIRMRTNKYMAKPTLYKGLRYASKAEATRAVELDLWQQAGHVRWWLRQVPVMIGEPGVDKPYLIDFLVCDKDGQVHGEDVKGIDTATFKRHVKQWRMRGPFPLHVIRGRHIEIIEPGDEQ